MTSQVLLVILFLDGILTRKALEYFVKNKKVRNFTMEIIKSSENLTNSDWIEYKYVFETDENQVTKNSLRVGFVSDAENTFDCHFHENQTAPTGYSADLISSIKDTLNISIETVLIENTTNLSQQLLHEVDLAVCHPFSPEMSPETTEIYSTIISNLVIIYDPNKLHSTKDIFILTFAGWLWTAFFGTLILLALCLRISTMKYSMIYPRKHEPWSWVEITLWAIAAACQQGLSHTPSGFASCCFFFLGYLLAYLLYTGFAAAITSILVQHDINSNTDFSKFESSRLSLVALESSRYFVQTYKKQFFTTNYVHDLDDLFANLGINNTIGIGPEIMISQYMTSRFSYEEVSSYVTVKLDSKYKKGFLIARNNSWRKAINKVILRMDELGLLHNMLERNLQPSQIPDLNSGYSSAGQEHVGSAILLFLGGVAVSIAFLAAEIFWYFYKKGRKNLGL